MNIIGPLNQLSYGITVANIVKELTKLGEDVALSPIGGKNYTDDYIERSLRTEPNPHNPSVRIWHASDMSLFSGRYRIGFPIFELDTFTEKEKLHLSSLDEVFVASHWAKEIMEQNVNVPCTVTPLGVDLEIFNPARFPEVKDKKVTFLNVGKWEVRKGHDILADVFAETFDKIDDVELWMSCHNVFVDNQVWQNQYKRKLKNKVTFLPSVSNHLGMAKFMSMVDVGVFPTRAEGWGLPILEMMAMEKQVVVTDCTGQTEYCNAENSLLVKTTKKVPAYDGVWFHKQGNWHEIDKQSLKKQLLESYERVKNNASRNESGRRTAERFSWGNTGRIISGRIGRIKESIVSR